MPFHLVKIGGSLIMQAKEIVRGMCSLSRDGHSFLVIAGGGPMADLVRDIYRRGEISDEAAHWMAVLAMEQYARLLADGTGAVITDDPRASARAPAKTSVLMPYLYLMNGDAGIEHNWDYTSDSIAALIASRLGTDMIKVTDVDGVILNGAALSEIDASSLLGKTTCIDQGSLRVLISSGRNCACSMDLPHRVSWSSSGPAEVPWRAEQLYSDGEHGHRVIARFIEVCTATT